MKEITLNLGFDGNGVAINLTEGIVIKRQVLEYDDNGKVKSLGLTIKDVNHTCACGCHADTEQTIMTKEFMDIIEEIEKQELENARLKEEERKKHRNLRKK